MKLLQEEFKSIDEGLKVSLKERVKFEICEKVISNSSGMFYIRLKMMQDHM